MDWSLGRGQAHDYVLKDHMHSQITKRNGNLYTWPKIVQGPASGTRRTRINSASFTILSARKCFKYPTKSSADLNCDIDDAVKGVDNPVPRCKKDKRKYI